jgi:hypothetical protein
LLLVVGALLAAACNGETEPVIAETAPLNGQTAVDISVAPELVLANSSELNLFPQEAEKAVLYRVAGDARRGVAGEVEWAGSTLTYHPNEPLEADADYELELKRSAINPEAVTHRDAAEWPEEPVSWPYRLRFSTRSGPRVRAAYLDVTGGSRRIHLRFSQPMNPAATEQLIGIRDLKGGELGFQQPVWSDGGMRLVLDLHDPLPGGGLYTLEVGAQAVALDGTSLDGDGDGNPGETEDRFRVQFTGTQQIIVSRLAGD